jgi:hypothetical protein
MEIDPYARTCLKKSASSDAATTWKLVFLIQKQNNVLTGSKKIMISCLKKHCPLFWENY